MSAIKIAGEWELDVRGNPYGADSDGQWFDSETEIVSGNEIPAVYYHGMRNDKKGFVDKPSVIGKAMNPEKRVDGIWWRVVLDKAKADARKVWEAALKFNAVASSGAIDYLSRLEINGKLQPYDKRKPGRIAVWHMGELSLWEHTQGRNPAHPYAVAIPALKAAYEQAGIELPDLQNEGEPSKPKAETSAARVQVAKARAREILAKINV